MLIQSDRPVVRCYCLSTSGVTVQVHLVLSERKDFPDILLSSGCCLLKQRAQTTGLLNQALVSFSNPHLVSDYISGIAFLSHLSSSYSWAGCGFTHPAHITMLTYCRHTTIPLFCNLQHCANVRDHHLLISSEHGQSELFRKSPRSLRL